MNRSSRPAPSSPAQLAFHVSRIVADLGVLLVLGAMNLPFVSAPDSAQQAVAADALPALWLVLPVFLFTLVPDHSRPVITPLGWLSLFLAAAALPYTVIKYLDASARAGTLGGSVGMGARLLVLGAFVVLGGVILGLIRRRPAAATTSGPVVGERRARPEPDRTSRGQQPAPGPAGSASVPSGVAPGRAVPPRPAAPPPQPRPAPSRPGGADPDSEPTLPGLQRTREWWPDDLEDLFS